MNPTDQALLEQFRTTNDQAAFEQLVQRHGPMVLGICRRILGSEPDAWDAFQSVFLALAKKAEVLQKHPAPSAWLHRAALFSAKKARLNLLRHSSRFQPLEEAAMQEPSAPGPDEEWGTSLDEEIQGLPDKYRFPVILCHVEKRTYEEVAVELKLSYRTLQRRLDEAKDLLRGRLARRGLGVTSTAMGMLLAQDALAEVPPQAIHLTAQAASSFTAGEVGAEGSGAISAKAMAMMKDTLETLWIQKIKSAALAGLVSLGTGAVIGAAAWHFYGKAAPAAIPQEGAKPTAAQNQRQILFRESFEDGGFASRGWYDNTDVMTTRIDSVPGSLRAAEYHFSTGATEPGAGPMRKLFTESDSVYVSYWVKYSNNYRGSQKEDRVSEFLLMTNEDEKWSGLSFTHLAAWIAQNNGKPVLVLQDGRNIDFSQIGQDLTAITEDRAIAGGNGVLPLEQASAVSWYQMDGTFRNSKEFDVGESNFSGSNDSYYKNEWHHVEAYFKLNTISGGKGNFDGILRYWYDGRLILERTSVAMRTGRHPDMKFNQLVIAPYMDAGSPTDQTFWVDDLTVATERP